MSSSSKRNGDFAQRMIERASQLKKEGFDSIHAHGIAWLEERIRQWPPAWGDDLHVLIYGDLEPPKARLEIDSLGIIVYPEKLENTIIGKALCVLEAKVTVKEKTIPALIDASRRINVLLGSHTLVEWSHGACGWWSWLTHGGVGGTVSGKLSNPDLEKAIHGILSLPPNVRKKVDSALYWVCEPKKMIFESYRNDLLRTYSAYWNAFECLVEAINIIWPAKKLSGSENQQLIAKIIENNGGQVTPNVIEEAYNSVVHPGFVPEACHALMVCFGNEGTIYINECFRLKRKRDRLYNIRNEINHGDIDAENPEELLRIEARLSRLWMILWGMFGKLIPFPAPLDSELPKNR